MKAKQVPPTSISVKANVRSATASSNGKVQSTIPVYSSAEDVMKVIKELLYKFFNTANISINQTKNRFLTDLLRTLVDHASLLKFRRTQLVFSPWKYKAQECKMFNNFTVFLTKAISSAREHYKDIIGKHAAFITVSHDAWDSKRRDMLGCCIHFVHPLYWKMISLPVGLKYLESKKSAEMVVQLNKILSRYVNKFT
jgi:hypothetical protein